MVQRSLVTTISSRPSCCYLGAWGWAPTCSSSRLPYHHHHHLHLSLSSSHAPSNNIIHHHHQAQPNQHHLSFPTIFEYSAGIEFSYYQGEREWGNLAFLHSFAFGGASFQNCIYNLYWFFICFHLLASLLYRSSEWAFGFMV
jgi:hypothetical protein